MSLPDPAFAGDDGRPDPALVNALAVRSVAAVQAVMVEARVFVPLVALLGASGTGAAGLRTDKSSDIAVITVQRPDGARALPAFSSLERLARWDASARPLPVEGPRAARAVYAEDAVALLVDPGAPDSVVLFGAVLLALAEGRTWLAPLEDPEVRQAIAEHVPEGVRWRLAESPVADATLALTYADATAESAAASARELAEQLAEVPLLRARLDSGIDLVVELG
jgi:hypothetical protein